MGTELITDMKIMATNYKYSTPVHKGFAGFSLKRGIYGEHDGENLVAFMSITHGDGENVQSFFTRQQLVDIAIQILSNV